MASRSFRGENEFIQALAYLTNEENPEEAQHLIRVVALLAVPIMRKYNLRIRLLTEFYPEKGGLKGLNDTSQQMICLRLRTPEDRTKFWNISDIMETMLHELAHNTFGPHNQDFMNRWNQYCTEFETQTPGGFEVGDQFLRDRFGDWSARNEPDAGPYIAGSQISGPPMAGPQIPEPQQSPLGITGGRKLGGTPHNPSMSVSQAAGLAALRRQKMALDECGTHNADAAAIVSRAVADGSRISMDISEDEKIIQQALWESIKTYQANRASTQARRSRNPSKSSAIASGSSSEPRSSRGLAGPNGEPGWYCDFCATINAFDVVNCNGCGVKRSGKETSGKGKKKERWS